MTEKERLDSLRRLRFPQPLEDEFQRHYFAQNRAFIRVCLLAATAPLFWYVYRAWRVFGVNLLPDPNLGAALLLLLRVGVTFLPWAWRVFYPVAVGLGVVESLTLNFDWLARIAALNEANQNLPHPLKLQTGPVLGYMLVMHFLMGLAYRLPSRWMTLYMLTAGLFVRQVLAHSGLAPEKVLGAVTGFLLIPALIVWLVAYYQERTARAEFIASRLLLEERDRSERLLLNVLPPAIAERLKAEPGTIAEAHPEVSVLFADIVGFTPLCARLSPATTVDLLNSIFTRFDELAQRHGIEKIKTVGDAYMAVAGLPTPRPDHLEALAQMALEMQATMEDAASESHESVRLRIGLDSGPVVAGVIGTTKFAYDLWGDTVNTASRMEAHGRPGEIQVTETVHACLKERFRFEGPFSVEVKGQGIRTTYFLVGERSGAPNERVIE